MAKRTIAGRTALITGGARGIGRAVAARLHAEGARVVICDIDEAALLATAEALSTPSRPVAAYGLDVRDREAFADLVARIEAEVGPVDVLVNNAGIMPIGPFLELDPLLDDRQIDINVRGVIHGMRAVLPGMLRRGRGHVVNIASSAGVIGVPYIGVYSSTKHAVVGLTEAVRLEVMERGVDLSYIAPSLVKTELISGTRHLRYPPPATPEDVAAAVVHALRTGRVDVFVPRFAGVGPVLKALLPRRVAETVGRMFGVDKVFERVDEAARRAYRERIRT